MLPHFPFGLFIHSYFTKGIDLWDTLIYNSSLLYRLLNFFKTRMFPNHQTTACFVCQFITAARETVSSFFSLQSGARGRLEIRVLQSFINIHSVLLHSPHKYHPNTPMLFKDKITTRYIHITRKVKRISQGTTVIDSAPTLKPKH